MLARRILHAAAFAALTIATAARADTVAPRRVVVVHVNGMPDETSALEATMRELLGRLQLTMATGGAPPGSVLETVTIDLGGAGGRVVVRSASGGVVLDRTVGGESAAIQREQIAHAVRGAAEAELLVDEDRVAGRAPPVVEEPAPAPAPAPAPEPPPKDAWPALPVVIAAPVAERPAPPRTESPSLGLDLSTLAGGGAFASDTSVVARVGGSVAVASRRGLRPQVALAALYAFPFETGDDNLSSRTKLFSLRVLPGLTILRASWFGLEAAAGAGFDVVMVDPVSSILSKTVLGPSTTRVDPIFTGTLTARADIAPDVSITLTTMLDVDPISRAYVFIDRGARSEVFSPWALRPMLLAGISFAAFGGGR